MHAQIYIILGFIFSSINLSLTDDVLGCGGFIKSHVQIDFSKVVVKLFTKNGILKDQTNCAPNNGYYFIPVYDRGDYVLKLEPPPGWSFNPTEINLTIDGKNDLCTKGTDINFAFKGFGITGRVESQFSDNGPSGVTVELKSGDEIRTTTTSKGGNFFFTPVYPGKYVVRIAHPKWKILKASVEVNVAEGNTELPPKSLVIKGYDVTGFVKADGEPVKDVHIIISTSEQKVVLDDCDKTKITDFKERQLCHVLTNSKGKFEFASVPLGNYILTPFLRGQNIHFQPNFVEIEVAQDSVALSKPFEVVGFNIPGKVLESPNGKPLAKARVIVNGKLARVTNEDGSFVLEKIKAGSHKIHVEADNLFFEEKTYKIKPTDSGLPDFVPSKYKVCGSVVSDKMQRVAIKNLENSDVLSATSDQKTGRFCVFLPAGKYELQVALSEREKDDGVQFFPNIRIVDVNSRTTQDVVFSQLKATVSGNVSCIVDTDCKNLRVLFRQILKGSSDGYEIIAEVINGVYKVNNVRPGTYEISLSSSKLCWQEDKFTINVISDTASVPTFVQKGYLVTFVSSHDTKVVYNGSEKVIKKGRTTHCLEKTGNYQFELKSCHVYENDVVSYDTGSQNNEIFLSAIKHNHRIAIDAPEGVKDVTMTVNHGGVKTKEGPLKHVDGFYILDITLSPGDSIVLIPNSEILYFKPPITSFVGEHDCAERKVAFRGIIGKVFQGKVQPPLPNVLMTLETEKEALTTETNAQGRYKFPPQDATRSYRLSAKKDSYVLIGPNQDGDFVAHKLAEIVVQVFDGDTGAPLQGALLSLSGGESYRSNLQTTEDGRITFNGLRPGEYFLRPMMKEYSFEPHSKIIDVEEGERVEMLLKGKRVAYSVFGQITSLNGDAEEGMVVVAAGTGNCSIYSEEATLEFKGNFRIRGLQPYCSYVVRAEKSPANKSPVERIIPAFINVANIKDDLFGFRFIIQKRETNAAILLKVYTPDPELYKTLKVTIYRESAPSEQIYSAKLDVYKLTQDANNGVLLQAPSIPIDGRAYSIQVEPTVNQGSRDKVQTHYFISNDTFKFIEIKYLIKASNTDSHMKQTSVWTLIGIFTLVFAVYNTERIFNFAKRKTNGTGTAASVKPNKQQTNEVVDNNDIDLIVQSIYAVKRKPKPKKI